MNNKTLILVSSPSAQGGISNYFQVLKDKFSFPVEYFIRGGRKQPFDKKLFSLIVYIYDFIRFFFKICFGNYKLVHINTSMGFSGLIRDGIFIIISKLFRLKVIVFFRGIDVKVIDKIENNHKKLFTKVYFKADTTLVLSNALRDRLLNWGYPNDIILETTVVDKDLCKDITANHLSKKASKNKISLLFLARIEKDKGVFETLDAYCICKKKYPQIQLKIAGDGKELKRVKEYVKKKEIKDVFFLGYVKGKQKKEAFQNNDIYLFPSFHGEGMPNSVLEAMAFGLPVITSKVGGIPDFFTEKMGIMIDSVEPGVICNVLEKLISSDNLRLEMSLYNFKYAQNRFTSDKVIKRLEKYYSELLNLTNE